jgi:F-type H+-transporting ATPase subunit delta
MKSMTSTMTYGLFARRYAGVLFQVVEPRGGSAKALDDLKAIAEATASSTELQQVFGNPAIPPARKRALVDAIAAAAGAGEEVRRMLGLLADRDRLDAIGEVSAAYSDQVMQARKTLEADVVTATPLTDDRRAELARVLGRAAQCQVTIRERVDPSIIGGVVARVGSLVFDGSVQRQVERLKEQLVSGGARGQ